MRPAQRAEAAGRARRHYEAMAAASGPELGLTRDLNINLRPGACAGAEWAVVWRRSEDGRLLVHPCRCNKIFFNLTIIFNV